MMAKAERMSPDLDLMDHCQPSCSPEEPRDLSVKRKMRPVPPPLDLSKRNLEPDVMIADLGGHCNISPLSPSLQKKLPLRKRAYSWTFQAEIQNLQMAQESSPGVIRATIEINTNSCNIPTTSSSSSSLRIAGLPTPHTPHTPHPHSAIPVITSRFDFESSNTEPTTKLEPTNLHMPNQGPLNLSTASVGALPSSLLSPAPSHPSTCSLNSSREELEGDNVNCDYHAISSRQNSPYLHSPHQSVRLNSPSISVSSQMYSPSSLGSTNNSVNVDMIDYITQETEPPESSASHHWPTAVWSIFMAGVQVHFVLSPNKITNSRMSEDLGQLEETHHQRYAPNGLHLMRILYCYNNITSPHPPPEGQPFYCNLVFHPYMAQQQDIMAALPPEHPFYVHSKGWCSLLPDHATERYGLPCQQLMEGDLCLPSYHPEATGASIHVATPDIADAMKKFDFNDEPLDTNIGSPLMSGTYSAPPSATFPPHTQRSVFLSPPASPSKKTIGKMNMAGMPSDGTAGAKPRRPMNGFMLFAKHHRLKLIQQYPGKDNRAISVLLGAMWKGLPEGDRERFNFEARVQAEERKRIDPDCWKRKRSHSTS